MKLISAVAILVLSQAEGKGCNVHKIDRATFKPVTSSPLPWDDRSTAMPAAWDWRNVSGVNYVSPNIQQHLPTYCGGCWLFGGLTALNDRMRVMRKNAWPDISLSEQVVLNCGTAAGTCQGGDVVALYKFIHEFGIPDDTCQVYQAQDLSCKANHICAECHNGEGCPAVKEYDVYHVEEFGMIPANDTDAMKREIYARGPITCEMDCTPILNYTGGIVGYHPVEDIDHIISIAGWGRGLNDKGVETEFWSIRTSWGSAWGENGWFRVETGSNSMGLEGNCSWAMPSAKATKRSGNSNVYLQSIPFPAVDPEPFPTPASFSKYEM